MRKYNTGLWLMGLVLIVAGCGGGGNDGGTFEPPPPARGFTVTVAADSSSLPAHTAETPVYPDDTPFATRVVVSVSRSEGGVPENGEQVTLRATPATSALVSAAPGVVIETDGGEVRDGFIPQGSSLSLPLQDGRAVFYVHSRSQAGQVALEGSYTGSGGSGSQTVTGSTSIQINTSSQEPLEAVSFIVQRSELPVNVSGNLTPFIGSPYTSSVVVIQRALDGSLMPPASRADEPVQGTIIGDDTAAISIPDDGSTEENEFTNLFSSVFAGRGAGGRSQFYVHALIEAGETEFSVSYLDTVTGTGESISATIPFRVVDTASNGLPATITAAQDSGGLYIEGSNGRTSKPVTLFVDDGGEQPVLDPTDAGGNPSVNNVQVEIIDNGGAADARLFANSATGSVSGTTIGTYTTVGQASFSVRAGSQVGTLTIRATADAADNNVDNGIADPVVANTSMVISDGQLFSLTLTTPFSEAVFANRVPEENGGLDGTYGLTVSVQANDRLGNPVLPGTPIQFGLVDSPFQNGTYPTDGTGVFAIMGPDGDPDEGRFNFFVDDETFVTGSDGRVEPGDSLLLLGQDVANNRNYDLELQRLVDSVLSDEELRVERRFNPNDGTGSIVDDGEIIPYIIGRAQHGAIEGSAQTNQAGVATVTLNYPISQLSRNVALWAQGEGGTFALDGGEFTRTVGDVALGNYASIVPWTITASPAIIPATGTTFVNVCVADALASPVPAAVVTFSSSGGGSVVVDGQAGSGTLLNATGGNGCVLAEVTPSGQTPDSESTIISFSAQFAPEPAEVEVAPVGGAVMLVNPSAIIGNRNVIVDITLLNGSGQPLSGVQISGECETDGDGAAIELLSGPGTTGADGTTAVQIRTTGFQSCESPPSGECIFTTASGSPEGTLDVIGIDISEIDFSPAPDPCPAP